MRIEATCAQRVTHLEVQEQGSMHNAVATQQRMAYLDSEPSEIARQNGRTSTSDQEAVRDLEVEYKAMCKHDVLWYGIAEKNQDLAFSKMEQAEGQK